MTSTVPTDGRSDFDFIFGRWQVRNRKLVDVVDPACDEWIEFDSAAATEPILGGLGHVERIRADTFEGFTLRQFDPEAGIWRIWWASSARPGHLDPPMEGAFSDGRGRFLCDDVLGGHAVKVRFEWTTDTADTARWEQAFSYDGGVTWRVNWTMDFTRAE
ncbi:hypothetical protein [Kibdelosporangium phytohabitans]|uniref:hypothetical protein n=1 Tax=Kibdelosporangium phytohabitans TaxID=860235 RepID=UPI0019ED7DD5|nr:hypothetical protein [Kibdelosporangium phytohabitans]MBE1470652.1 hypothetical protein [Kibdelosporangium phytohabitans]